MFLPDEYLAVREAVWLVARWAERRELSDGLAGDGEGAASVVIAQKLAGGHLAALAWVADGRFFQLPATFWRTAQVFDTLDAGEISFPPDYGVPPVKLLIPKADLERALGVRSVAGMGDLPSDGMSSRAQPVLALHVGPGVGAVAETLLNHQLDALGLPRGLPKRRPKVRLATPEEVEFFEAKGRQALQDWWENLPRPPFTPSGHLWIATAVSKVADLHITPARALPEPDPRVSLGKVDLQFARAWEEDLQDIKQGTAVATRTLLQALGDGALQAYGLSERDGSFEKLPPNQWRASGGQDALRQGYVAPPDSGDGARVWIMIREADLTDLLLKQFGDDPPGWLGEAKAKREVAQASRSEAESTSSAVTEEALTVPPHEPAHVADQAGEDAILQVMIRFCSGSKQRPKKADLIRAVVQETSCKRDVARDIYKDRLPDQYKNRVGGRAEEDAKT